MREILLYTDCDVVIGRRANGKLMVHEFEKPLRVIGGDETMVLVKEAGKGNHTPFEVRASALYFKTPYKKWERVFDNNAIMVILGSLKR